MPAGTTLDAADPDPEYLRVTREVHDSFSWDLHRAHELAVFCSFAVPSISRILDETGEFARHGQERYDDTVALLREIGRDGPASAHGRAAIRHLNRIHRPFAIPNEDLLYVLATLVVVPVRWIGRYGWRSLAEHEIRAAVCYYRVAGRLMGITRIPGTYEEFAAYLDAYQRDRWSLTPEGQRLAASLADVLASWFPRLARPFVLRCVTAALGRPLQQALGLPEPSGLTRAGVHTALRARAVIIRLAPALRRRGPRLRRLRSYPFGYEVGELGPAR